MIDEGLFGFIQLRDRLIYLLAQTDITDEYRDRLKTLLEKVEKRISMRKSTVVSPESKRSWLKERRQSVFYSLSTLLTRNLVEIFGENDSERRRAALDEIWQEDGVFYDSKKGV